MKLTERDEEVMAEIGVHAKWLNSEAERASRFISKIQENLNAAGVGVEVWLGDIGYYRVQGAGTFPVQGEWAIGVDPSIHGAPGAQDAPPVVRLLDADRATRIALAPKLPALLVRIKFVLADTVKEVEACPG